MKLVYESKLPEVTAVIGILSHGLEEEHIQYTRVHDLSQTGFQ